MRLVRAAIAATACAGALLLHGAAPGAPAAAGATAASRGGDAGSSTDRDRRRARSSQRRRGAHARRPAGRRSARNPHLGVGIGGVENNPIRAAGHLLGERIVLDRPTRMRWFITGFNLEGVHTGPGGGEAPPDIRSSSWLKPRQPSPAASPGAWSPGSGRTGYANGDGGTIWFRLVTARPDGTPDLARVVAEERINAVAAYRRTQAEFGTRLTQLIGFEVGRTVAAGEYVAVFANAAANPDVDYFSHNFPTFDGASPNTRNERDPRAPGALGGLDPRETIMWSTSGGRSWVFGSLVGDGEPYGYYPARENRRVPWYGWQEAPGQKARYQQPFNQYGAPVRRPVLRLRAPRALRLTRAGGWGAGAGVGVVTVTAGGRRARTRPLGTGLSAGRLSRPLAVRAGEEYTITASGAVPLARADGYVDATFGALPWSTDGAGNDRAQLFAE
jgi:hypothetical protein